MQPSKMVARIYNQILYRMDIEGGMLLGQVMIIIERVLLSKRENDAVAPPSRKPGWALGSLLSVALSSLSVKLFHYTMARGLLNLHLY